MTEISISELIQGGGLLAFAWAVLLEIKQMRSTLRDHLSDSHQVQVLIAERIGSIDSRLDNLNGQFRGEDHHVGSD